MPLVCGDRNAVAVIDQIRAVAKERLQQRLAVASIEDIERVEDALKQILELS
jgi:mRNA-degrading endonuclease toxin of MazEF toxin-antitoxin module